MSLQAVTDIQGDRVVRSTPETHAGLPSRPSEPKLRRWWSAVILGSLLSLPAGWLLSYAALLPFLLGLFFFVLIGLVVGAAMYRMAAKGATPRRLSLLTGTTWVVLVGWGTSILKESHDFPWDVAVRASNTTADLEGLSPAEFRAKVAQEVRRFLQEKFPPGGLIGYTHWVLTRGELRESDLSVLKRRYVRDQRGVWWAIRVVLSVGLFAFGIGSQTFSLNSAGAPEPR